MQERTYKTDKELGDELELSILDKVISPLYPKAFLTEVKCPEYDIWIPELSSGVEVKYDLGARKTDNLFIEFEHNNKPSGIEVTDSDLWLHFDGTWLFFFTPNKMNQMIRYESPYITSNRHDRNSNVLTKGYLIDKEICEQYAYRLIPYEL
jgi:hypothetical protein